jgi:hypothetical protein
MASSYSLAVPKKDNSFFSWRQSATSILMYTRVECDDISFSFSHVVAGLVAGLAVTSFMHPFDVVSTRLYSQKIMNGHGVLYTGVLDCFQKTIAAEGVRGLFKGWLAHYLRAGPHTLLSLVLWEQFKTIASQYGC